MTCTHALNGGPLLCDRTSIHDPEAVGGHTYHAAWCADSHDTTEARDD